MTGRARRSRRATTRARTGAPRHRRSRGCAGSRARDRRPAARAGSVVEVDRLPHRLGEPALACCRSWEHRGRVVAQRDPGTRREPLDRFGEVEPVELAHERDRVAALLAPEAVVERRARGFTEKLGLFSEWNGHRPTKRRPTRFSARRSLMSPTMSVASRTCATSSSRIPIALRVRQASRRSAGQCRAPLTGRSRRRARRAATPDPSRGGPRPG